MEKNIRTCKLKIYVIGDDRKETWKRLYPIFNTAWRAMNWIVGGQYNNDILMRRVYARKQIDVKDLEAVSAVERDFEKFFGTKRQATTERDVKAAFPALPPCITNPMNQVVVSNYNKEKNDMLQGKRSLRTYKGTVPVTVTQNSIKFLQRENGEHYISWTLGRTEHILFGIVYGRDKANYRLTIQRIIDGDVDFSAPQIQYKDKELFLHLPVQEDVKKIKLDQKLSVGVDLGLAIPAYVALSKGPQRKAIGSKDTFLHVRGQMQARHRDLQRSLTMVKGGHGRTRKLKAMNRIEGKERRFAKQYNHFVSKRVVDFAVQNGAGTIKMEMLEGFDKEHKDSFILRNWSYFELQTAIEYKAKRFGIKTVKVDPYHTSQTCSECGHFEEGQRPSQSKFICKKCGKEFNADHNAALNIARSKQIVTKKEQCEKYKQMSKRKNTEMACVA